jgi:vacuolar-type H+-ATPase subunit E/Vma4
MNRQTHQRLICLATISEALNYDTVFRALPKFLKNFFNQLGLPLEAVPQSSKTKTIARFLELLKTAPEKVHNDQN